MPFTSPSYIPALPFSPPDDVPVHEFLFGRESQTKYGRRHAVADSKPPFICGVTGASYSAVDVAERIELLARGLASKLNWQVNAGDVLEKAVAIYSLNSIDALTVSWATHRLNGVSVPISSLLAVNELANQLKKTKSRALVTCLPLLDVALQAAEIAAIPRSSIFLLNIPGSGQHASAGDILSIDALIELGRTMHSLPDLVWESGQGTRQVAYLCSSSGTSGLPKGVMISHRNAIANIMQIVTYEMSQASIWRGDGVVVLQGFELEQTMLAIQENKIKRLWLVPPMLVAIAKTPRIAQSYDLSSVSIAAVGASGISTDVLNAFGELLPECKVIQGYGMTETTGVVCFGNVEDSMTGSCGHLYPGYEARLIDEHGGDIDAYNTPGELLLRSPSVVLGYYEDEVATSEALIDGEWLRTGDLVEIRPSENGHEHVFIVDRVKELIKVRGLQVAPAELESHLVLHSAVAEVAVVPIPDERAGELPKAYVVKAEGVGLDEKALREELSRYVEEAFARHKHLDGGIEFLDSLPKTASGKMQRKVLKEMAKMDAEARERARKEIENGKSKVVTNGFKRREKIEIFDLSSDEDED